MDKEQLTKKHEAYNLSNLVKHGCYVIVMLGKWTRGFKQIGKIFWIYMKSKGY